MDKVKVICNVGGSIESARELKQHLKAGGRFHYECYDKDGALKWEVDSKNTITTEGFNYILDNLFGVAVKISTWYLGLYTATIGSFSDLTGADIGGAKITEFTGFTGTRKSYAGIRSGLSWTNAATKAEFGISSTATIKGAFLASDDAGTAAYLLAIDSFAEGDRVVSPSDTLKVSYIFNVANV